MIANVDDDETLQNRIILISDENIQLKEDSNEIILKSSLGSNSGHSIITTLDRDLENNNIDIAENEKSSPTPIPKIKLFAIFIIMLCDAINAVSLFPYVTFMVQDFNLTDNDKVLGYYIGVLASSYYFSQLFSSFFWGWFSNRYGRRPAVICGLIGSMICLMGFGLSKQYALSILFRFLSGLLNGNVSVAKTMLGEITDSTNQARAFSLIGLSWSIGGITAPLIGGVTSNICKKGGFELKPSFILCQFPYLLPNIICFTFSLIGLLLTYFFLQETLSFKVKSNSTSSTSIYTILIKIYKKMKEIWFKFTKNDHKELVNENSMNDLIKITSLEKSNSIESEIFKLEDESNQIGVDDSDEDYSDGPRSIGELVQDKPVFYSCVIYALLGFSYTIFEECFPVWSSIVRDYNPKNGKVEGGGYGFDSVDIGVIQSFAGTFALFIQLFIFPPLVNKLGLIKSFKISMIIVLPSWILLPELSRLTVLYPGESEVNHSTLFWVLLFPCYMFQSFASEISFISIIVMISNSCLPKDMALVNSIGMFLVSISRTVGPITGSSLLAATMSHDLPYPLDFHFIFVIELILFIGLLLLAHFLLPNSLNYTKDKAIVLNDFDDKDHIITSSNRNNNNNTNENKI